ncbi:MAG: hypothetical protein RLZZ468_1348 [Cyanobacteriota bacterium]|jgi:uncharacterized protein (TIGR03792 family)
MGPAQLLEKVWPRPLAGLLSLFALVVLALAPGPAVTPSANAMTAPQPDPHGGVIELLRLQVPTAARQAWLEAERGSWEPWLERQPGFLGRELLWDPQRQEGTLVIRWASREQWKAIPATEVERVQRCFEQLARGALGQEEGNPFPLLREAELIPQ